MDTLKNGLKKSKNMVILNKTNQNFSKTTEMHTTYFEIFRFYAFQNYLDFKRIQKTNFSIQIAF